MKCLINRKQWLPLTDLMNLNLTEELSLLRKQRKEAVRKEGVTDFREKEDINSVLNEE